MYSVFSSIPAGSDEGHCMVVIWYCRSKSQNTSSDERLIFSMIIDSDSEAGLGSGFKCLNGGADIWVFHFIHVLCISNRVSQGVLTELEAFWPHISAIFKHDDWSRG